MKLKSSNKLKHDPQLIRRLTADAKASHKAAAGSITDGLAANGCVEPSRWPVCAAPCTEVGEPIATRKYIVLDLRRILRFLAANNAYQPRVRAIVPPCETRATGIAMVEVAVLGFQFFASIGVAISVIDCESLLKRRFFGVVNISWVADVAPYGQIVPVS